MTGKNGITQPVSLSQAAYEAIKKKIVSLELPPGAVIDETALRTELDLGRTPVREALQRLAMEKLVAIIPRRGTFVTEIAITDLQRLFEARVEFEGLAARLACRRGTEAQWQRMEEALASVPKDGDLDNEALISIDEVCHQIMYEAADNKFLEDTLVALYALSLRLWYYALAQVGHMRQTVLEHRQILAALRARDADRAASLLQQHLQTFQEEIQVVMLGTPNG